MELEKNRQTEIVEPYKLPAGWKWCKQSEVCKLVDGEKIADKEYPYLEVKYLRGTKEKSFVTSGKLIKKGTKVILVDGENSGEVFAIHEDGYMGSTFKALSIENVDENYLQYFITTKKDLYRNNKKGSAIPHLNKDLFKNMPFPLPPTLAEQQRIVNRVETMFAKLDEAKEKAQNVVDSFETRKAAILHKAFTGELTANWRKENNPEESSKYLEKIKDKVEIRLDFKYWENTKLPESWCESTIGNLLYFAGRVGWKGLKAEEYTSEGPILLSVYNLNDGDEVSFNKINHITNERYDESPEIMVRKNDILLTKDGAGIGKLGYVNELPEKATINSSLLLIRSGDVANYKFIFYLLSGPALQNIVKERITGSATPHLFQRDIKEFVLPVPSLPEQQEIVRILDTVLEKESRAKEAAQTVLDQIALLKKSILARAFRGEL
ncbi:MAG: restriction endonuclease subunit S [Treponema sp.]|nr:restriction endonuclease subunit S [Treponema sp.]